MSMTPTPHQPDLDHEEIETGSNVEVEPQGDAATAEQAQEGYWCVICNRFLQAEEIDAENNLIVHDDVPHPNNMTYDEETRPQ